MADLILKHNSVAIGRIKHAFCSDDTWYGTFEELSAENDPLRTEIAEYITFCRDWHERNRNAPPLPRPDEFDRYSVLFEGWVMEEESGSCASRIDSIPIFDGRQISWREKE